MGDQVPTALISQRCRVLRELDKNKRLTFLNRFLGKVRSVLVENRQDATTGLSCGFSDNYLPVLVQTDVSLENQNVLARFDHIEGRKLVATVV